jgi:cob(I)alamin adenosyltransferase
MSITTKTGDDGLTSLWSGERVRKDDKRVEAYGTIDELMSFLCEARYYSKRAETSKILLELQQDFFRICSELASKTKEPKAPITNEDVSRLENHIAFFEDNLKLQGFVVLGTTLQSAKLDVCRAIARRAERRVLFLAAVEEVHIPLRKYINRISDLLFLLGRWEEHGEGKIEYR